MVSCLEKLVSISSGAIDTWSIGPGIDGSAFEMAGALKEELFHLYRQCNGFFGFESSLHLFSLSSSSVSAGLFDWNSESLWRYEYGDLSSECLFFAEDLFGGQFCIKYNEVLYFDPETAELKKVADTLEGWAKEILDNYEYWTGYPLAHEWQKKYGPLPMRHRLMPKIPFVCGGSFDLKNLTLINDVSGMKSRGNLARQIHKLEDGAKIKFKIIK